MDRIDGIMAAAKYLKTKQQARETRIFAVAYWGILSVMIVIALAFAFVKLGVI